MIFTFKKHNSNFSKSKRSKFVMLLIILWLVSIISTFLIVWNKQQDHTEAIMLQSLNQSQYQTDRVYSRIERLSSRIIRHQDIATWLYSRVDTTESRTNIIRLLSNYAAASEDLIGSIGIFNSYLEIYITSSGTMPVSSLGNPVGIDQFSMRPREISVPTQASGQYESESFKRILTFYTRVDENPQRTNQGMLVVNIDEDIWSGPNQKHIESSEYYLLNKTGIVLSSSNPERYITDLSYDSDFTEFFQAYTMSQLDRSISEHSQITAIGGKLHLLVWTVSEDTELVSLLTFPLGRIIAAAAVSSLPWIGLITAIHIFSLLLLIKISNSYNEPVQRMIRYMSPGMLEQAASSDTSEQTADISLIQSALLYGEKTGQLAEEKYLLDLIDGRSPIGKNVELSLPQEIKRGPWVLVAARFDDYFRLSDEHRQDIASYSFMVINVTQELLSSNGSCRGLSTAENEMVFLYCPVFDSQAETLDSKLDHILQEAQQYLRQYFGFTVTYIWNDPVQSTNEFAAVIETSRRAFSIRYTAGRSLRVNSAIAQDTAKKLRYPNSAEKHILEAMNLKQDDKLVSGLDLFVDHLSEGYSPRTLDYINQLMLVVFKQVEHTIELQDDDFEKYVNTSKRIALLDNLNEIRNEILKFCRYLMSISYEQSRDMLQQKHDQLISDIRNYLADSMQDFDLSLESTADKFNLSAGYLGKLFKSATGENFSHYLINLRLNEAARLLTDTAIPAKTICEKIGMTNVTYFSTLFKKHMGLSPIRYREKMQKE